MALHNDVYINSVTCVDGIRCGMAVPRTYPSVAIIGGGISGLICAGRLRQLGVTQTTVFDTGKHAVGGRCSSRTVLIDGQLHIFDHSAQYFTVSEPQFTNVVSYLIAKGAVKIWKGPIGHITRRGEFHRASSDQQAFVGVDGMRSVAECLGLLATIKRPVWVSSVAWHDTMKRWQVGEHGFFDYLVIAHNGKCADRLLATCGLPQVHSLLRVRFTDRLIQKDARMQLCSIWALLVAFPQSLNLPYEGAHVDDPDISWIANNTEKLRTSASRGGVECWTIFSSRTFGSSHKVPQENIPPKKRQLVIGLLLDGFSRATKLPRLKLTPCYADVQLWGAAVPMNVLDNGDKCVFETAHQVGVCGDWFSTPSIEGAAMSGITLAEKLASHCKGQMGLSTAMDARFLAADSTAIGAFPSNPKLRLQTH